MSREWTVDELHVSVHADKAAMGAEAAADVATALRRVLARQGSARVVFASAPSQDSLLDGLAAAPDIDWSAVTALNMDEYVGLPASAPQSFAAYLQERLFSRVRPGRVDLVDGAADPAAEVGRYSAVLAEAPVDIVCLGIGENGHIAFNDPGIADFADPAAVRIVALDERSRQQQVNDGCFPALDDVPRGAITLTVPALVGAAEMFCVVPGSTKAEAAARMLTGPVGPDCPATVLRRHSAAGLYLDTDSASMLPG